MSGSTPSTSSSLPCAVLTIIFMFGLGVTLFVLGIVYDIQDLVILGSIFLGFTVMIATCVCVFVIRPIYNQRKVSQKETHGAGVEDVGFSGSAEDLEKITNSFVKIKVEGDDSVSVTTERDADNIIVDVKSRLGSATSAGSSMLPDGQRKKTVSFY